MMMMMIKGQTMPNIVHISKSSHLRGTVVLRYLLPRAQSRDPLRLVFYLISYVSFTPFPRILINRALQNTLGQTAPGPKNVHVGTISRRFQYARQNDKHGPSPRHL